jgi:uncharacterized protein (DUF342 family)
VRALGAHAGLERAMGSSAKAKTEQIRVVVSDDRLQAWIELPGKALPGFKPPTSKDIMAALEEKAIEVTDLVRERVKEYIGIIGGPSESQGTEGPSESQGTDGPADSQGTEGPPEIPERFLIAEGQPAVDAKHGDFEWHHAFVRSVQDREGEARTNHYAANSILTVGAGTVIGRIINPAPSREGRDVFGKEVRPKRNKGLPMELGDGLALARDDPLQVVTTIPGRLVRQGQKLRMDEVLEISGDVDFRSGNVDSVIDVSVRGDVKPNFVVKTTKSLTVQGSVEAARLNVDGDIHVRGGLFGQDSGCTVRAGGEVTAAICDGVKVEAGGNIRISKEIINSELRTAGELLIDHGSLIGGEVFARNGAKLKFAGSELGVPTRIAVGRDGAVVYQAQRIDAQAGKQTQQAEQSRSKAQPLIADLKRLTPAQREQATELLANATDAEQVAAELRAQHDRMLEEATPGKKPGIEVEGMLYPGVVLVFELREARIKTPVKGPVRVEEREVKGMTEIAIVNELTASVVPLPSAMVDVRRFEQVEEEPGVSDGAEQERSDDGEA